MSLSRVLGKGDHSAAHYPLSINDQNPCPPSLPSPPAVSFFFPLHLIHPFANLTIHNCLGVHHWKCISETEQRPDISHKRRRTGLQQFLSSLGKHNKYRQEEAQQNTTALLDLNDNTHEFNQLRPGGTNLKET